MPHDPFTASELPLPVTAGELLPLLFRTNHQLHRRFEILLAAYELEVPISGPRLRFLIAVSEAGQIRMSDMAAKLGIQARTVTQFVDALEHEGLLVRLPDSTDRRATLLQVTESALPHMARSRAAMAEAAERTLAPLHPEDRTLMLRLLKRLAEDDVIPELASPE